MSKHIGAFGEVMMRMQVPGHALLSQASTLEYSFSGTGVNVLSALSRFGYTSSLVTTLPYHSLGEAAIAHLRRLGISTSLINRDGQYLGMYFLENGFGIRPSRVTYTNRLESSFNRGKGDLYHFENIANQLDLVHFCGITLAMNDSIREQMKSFATAMTVQNKTVVFDCNYRPGLWHDANYPNSYERARPHYEDMLRLADVVMMNEKDAIYTLNMKTEQSNRKQQLIELIPRVAKKYDIKVIAGTHRTINENGTHSLTGFIFKDDEFSFSKPLTFSVLDRIGAGDAYSSGIIHGLLKESLTNQKIVDFATTAAMLAHTYEGDSPLATPEEIEHHLAGKMGDVQR